MYVDMMMLTLSIVSNHNNNYTTRQHNAGRYNIQYASHITSGLKNYISMSLVRDKGNTV